MMTTASATLAVKPPSRPTIPVILADGFGELQGVDEVGRDILFDVSAADGEDEDGVFPAQAGGFEPGFKNGGPAFIISAGGEFRDVVGRGIGFDADNFAEVIDGMGGVAGGAADAEDEEAAVGGARLGEDGGDFFDGGGVDGLADFGGFSEEGFNEGHGGLLLIGDGALWRRGGGKSTRGRSVFAEEIGGVFNARERADFIEALVDLIAGELAIGEELLIERGQVKGCVRWNPIKCGGAEDAQAVVDVVHVGKFGFLVVGEDFGAIEDDVRGIKLAEVFVDGHESGFAGGDEVLLHSEVINGEIGIPIEGEKAAAKRGDGGDGTLERAGGALEFGAIENVIHMKAEGGTVAHDGLDHLAQVADAENDVAYAAGVEQTELVGDKRLAIDFKQDFGDLFRQRAQARGQSAGEDRDGERLYWILCHRSHLWKREAGEPPAMQLILHNDAGALEIKAEANLA